MRHTTPPRRFAEQSPDSQYDPWADLHHNWPDYHVVIEPLPDDLLGEVREGGIIALCEHTTTRQRRCTLAHEIVHLERGLAPCGVWQSREEAAIEAEVARRLIPLPALAAALREVGGDRDQTALCCWLDVDQLILQARFDALDRAEWSALRRMLANQRELWSVA